LKITGVSSSGIEKRIGKCKNGFNSVGRQSSGPKEGIKKQLEGTGCAEIKMGGLYTLWEGIATSRKPSRTGLQPEEGESSKVVFHGFHPSR